MSVAPSTRDNRPATFDELLASRLVRRTRTAQLHAPWWPIRLLADVESQRYRESLLEGGDRAEYHYLSVFRECLQAFEPSDDESDEAFALRRQKLIHTFVRDLRNILACPHERLLNHAVDPGPIRKANPPARADTGPRRQALATLLRLAMPPAERLRLFADSAWQKRAEFMLDQIAIARAELGEAGPYESTDPATLVELHFMRADVPMKRPPREGWLPSKKPSIQHSIMALQGVRDRLDKGRDLPSELEVRTIASRLIQLGAIPLAADAAVIVVAVQLAGNDIDGAEQTLQAAIEFAQEHSDRRGAALASWELGKLLLAHGRREQGEGRCHVQLAYLREIGHRQREQAESELAALVNSRTSARAGTKSVRKRGPAKKTEKKAVEKTAKRAAKKVAKRTAKKAAKK